MKNIQLFPFVFLFIFLLSSPALAYLDVDVNVTYTGGLINNHGIVCTNNTGTFYCYHFAENGATQHMIVERYNATWGDLKTCDTGAAGAYAQAYWRNPAIANTTHLIVPHYSSGSGGYRLIPIWNMTDSATCTSTDTLGTGDQLFNSSSSVLYGGGYYNIDSNNASAWVYWGDINGIRNSTDNTWLSLGFWGTDKSLRLPDQADNTTIYGYDIANLPYQLRKYIGGAFSSNSGNVTQLWGLGFNNCGWDVWEETLNTTWLYAFDGSYFYRVNLTEGEALGSGSQVYAVSPVENETISSNPPQLHAVVVSTLNGTLTWFVDDVMQPNTTLNQTSGVKNVYFTPTSPLSSGHHTWYLIFTDSNGYHWIMTPPAEFIIGLEPFTLGNPIKGGAGELGRIFNVDNQEDAEAMYSILMSLFAALFTSVMLIIITKGKHIDGNNMILLFCVVFMAGMLVFTIAGMINVFYASLLIVLTALGLWAVLGGLGGG